MSKNLENFGLRCDVRFDYDEHENYVKLAKENKGALLEAITNIFNDAELEGHDELSSITSILFKLQRAAKSQKELEKFLEVLEKGGIQ
jgi:predicted RNA binding protein with dsRBD fold (UPF0201 family)